MSYVCSSAFSHFSFRRPRSSVAIPRSTGHPRSLAVWPSATYATYPATPPASGGVSAGLLFGLGNCVVIWGKVFEDDRVVHRAQLIVFEGKGYFRRLYTSHTSSTPYGRA